LEIWIGANASRVHPKANHHGLTIAGQGRASQQKPPADVRDGSFVADRVRECGRSGGPRFGQSGKWLELLKEIAPRVTRAAVLLNRAFAGGVAQLGAIQAVAPLFGVEVKPIEMRDAGETEQAIVDFARTSNGSLILTSAGSGARRELVIALAARHRLPAVYPFPYQVASGGLASYGADIVDQYRRAAGYVDRILKGEKPADLPVQTPTKYRLAINLKDCQDARPARARLAARARR
jgi:ABC transporter substrate binding protein